MTWRVVAASAVGTSHASSGVECQDRCIARVEFAASDGPQLVIFLADGAGSASQASAGAQLAVEAASEYASCLITEKQPPTLDDRWAVECLRAVQGKILFAATEQGLMARDFACTFLGVVASPTSTLLMQIGDGGIVVDAGNGLEVPIAPMAGEYANMTHFVTDENATDVFAVFPLPNRVGRIAVFSDGLQRLALNLASNSAFPPFFDPFFQVLETATSEQESELSAQLGRFLQCDAVNERTDDDKTLALAHWVS